LVLFGLGSILDHQLVINFKRREFTKKKKLNKEFMNPKVVDIEEDKPELLE
jgi:hypothetical protein